MYRWLSLACALLLPVTAQADSSGSEFWDRGSGFAGNGDIEVYAGTDTSHPENLVWKIDGDTVSENTSSSGGVDVLPIAVLDDNAINDPTTKAATNCEVEEVIMNFGPVYKVVNSQTNLVEVSVFNRFVFSGDVNPSSAADLMNNSDLFCRFDEHQIEFPDGEVAVTATANIQAANPMRRATLAALVKGACGASAPPAD